MSEAAPATVTRTPSDAQRLATFARNLVRLMHEKGMTQSDLARAVWGDAIDARGHRVARNRDRISHYVRGMDMPTARVVSLLARALGVPNDALMPLPDGMQRDPTPVRAMSLLGGRPDLARLTINECVPTRVAVEILTILTLADAARPPTAENVDTDAKADADESEVAPEVAPEDAPVQLHQAKTKKTMPAPVAIIPSSERTRR